MSSCKCTIREPCSIIRMTRLWANALISVFLVLWKDFNAVYNVVLKSKLCDVVGLCMIEPTLQMVSNADSEEREATELKLWETKGEDH